VIHITEDEIRDFAKSKNSDAIEDVEKMNFGLWKEEHFEQSIKEDVLKLRAEKSRDGLEIYGFALETQTGIVREISI
jgi:carbonic anhydrase